MVQKYLDGDVVGAREIQIKAIPLCEALFCEVNPIPVKKAVELMGLCEGNLRMPLTELEPEHTEQLKKAMTGFGVKSSNTDRQTGRKNNDSCDYAWL